MAKIKQETQFIEERYKLELETQKEKNSKNNILTILVFSIISLSSIILYAWSKLVISQKEKALVQEQREKLLLLYNRLEDEKESLNEALLQNKTLDKEIQNALTDRIDLVNQILVMEITGNYNQNLKAWEKIISIIHDKDSFINTTKLAFEASHPKFISALKEKKLSELEVGYSCLYAIGLKGKEIGSYTKNGRLYNISSDIRAKLGLTPNDTNLGIYLRELLKGTRI